MPKRRRVLKKGERRELERMKSSVGALHNFLGGKSEEAAEAICSALLQEKKLKNFWHIPSDSVLDRQGIDIIYETERGFFFINVKKSIFGVTKFVQRRETLKGKNNIDFHIIYPWRVIPELNRQGEARADLEKILNEESPSCDILPEDIKRELINPTKKQQQNKKQDDFEVLEQKLGAIIERKKCAHIWEVTIYAKIGNVFKEVKGYGEKRREAEISAYQELFKDTRV